RQVDRLEAFLRRHPLVTLLVVADAVLRGIAARRQRGGDLVDVGGLGDERPETAGQADGLADRIEVRCGLAADPAGVPRPIVDRCGHGLWSFSSAASRSAGLTGTICCVAAAAPMAGRWMKAPTRRQASRETSSIR